MSLAVCACESGGGAPAPAARQAALEAPGPQVAKLTVVSAAARLGTMGTRREEALYTDLELRIDARIYGALPDRVLVTTLGGALGDRAMHVSGCPELRAGDEVIAWLEPSSLKPFVELLWVRDGRVYASDGRPLLAVQDGGLVFGGREGPARPAPVPLGKASGALLTPQPGEAMSVAEAIEALRR
jgi:hypothetical protein